ncbi:beta-1,4-mannosyltransferase [Klebsormidium nitens]|uniref:Beta-1,4-mannosyltransferase n=1 Tax=Klebsormidium nitens TaxID=105231 RepID=A0A1Y1I385_KLENI|nr:beta-1,4-mannosyltransferase [Klebsormidium nitens]|eukprot:GAQ82578.1 beta-1,4-mannosyltransferase [Klebsormidium nitens]
MAKRGRATVVVLGDLGRSPRMQYHALSLAEQAELQVDVVAHAGSEPLTALKEHPNVHLHLSSPPWSANLPRVMYLLLLPFKVLAQFVSLLWVLCVTIPPPDFIIVQNPPSIPSLTVVLFVCWLRGAAMVIDWHNFGYTLLGLKLGLSHPFVRYYKWYERNYGRMAHAHLCVTKAMQQELAANWGINATVLYDRPPAFFRPATLEERHALFLKLNDAICRPPSDVSDCCGTGSSEPGTSERKGEQDDSLDDYVIVPPRVEETVISSHHMGSIAPPSSDGDGASSSGGSSDTVYEEQGIALKPDRPAVIVSSTSWTPDEDFDVLLQAAMMYDLRAAKLMGDNTPGEPSTAGSQRYPRLLFLITGKGPLKAQFEERVAKLRLKRVAFRTLWLSSEDYPRLLGSADLGVSLHTSSSGLDLPMKVVDMFGCALPVCARAYSCIGELVRDRENGLLFSAPTELADQLMELFRGFPQSGGELLKGLRKGSAQSRAVGWQEEWGKRVLPLLEGLKRA